MKKFQKLFHFQTNLENKSLILLSASHCQFSDDVMNDFQGILNNSFISFSTFFFPSVLPQLKFLNLSFTKIGDIGIKRVVSFCPNLVALSIGGKDINSISLDHISKLSELEILLIWQTKIHHDKLSSKLGNLKKLHALDERIIKKANNNNNNSTNIVPNNSRIDGKPEDLTTFVFQHPDVPKFFALFQK